MSITVSLDGPTRSVKTTWPTTRKMRPKKAAKRQTA
jgi:hypothetical protein